MVGQVDPDVPDQHIRMVTWWLLAAHLVEMDIRYRFLYGTLRRYFSTAQHDASDGACRDCGQNQRRGLRGKLRQSGHPSARRAMEYC